MRFVDFIIGLAVLLVGAIPLLSNITALESVSKIIGEPGKIVYQGILIIIGLLAIGYSFNDRRYVARR